MAGGSKKKGHGKHHDLALTVTAVLVIAGVMMLQILARRLKRWSESQKHANDILEASERELSVLGLIAFGLFVLEQTASLTQGDWVPVFHEVHFALFTVALFYVLVNVALYVLSRYFGRLWVAFEDAEIHEHWKIAGRLHRLRARLHIPALDHHLFFGSFWVRGLIRHPLLWLEYQRALEHMTFHEVRRDFLRVHHLPHSFSFASYLESCMQHVCVEFSEIRDTVWFIGILGLVFHLFFSTLISESNVSTTLTYLGVTVAVLCLLVFLKVKWIYWFILHSEILYRGGAADDDNAEDEDLPEGDSKEIGLADAEGGGASGTDELDEPRSFSSMHKRLFWFGNPGLVVTLLETCLFVLSGSIALFLFKLEKLYKTKQLAAPLGSLVGATCLLFFLVPRIVPRFTLITHVGEMSDPQRIAEVVQKQQARGDFACSGAPPSLTRKRRRDLEYASREPEPTCAERVRLAVSAAINEPGISSASAVASITYAFLVAVTLNESGARSVFNGHVLVIRDIELALGAIFVVEATARLVVAPREVARQLDAALVAATVGANVVSFVLRPRRIARALHAFSAMVVFRVVTTMWHNELRLLRFEHLRLSPDDLLKKETGLTAERVLEDEQHDILTHGVRHSQTLPCWVGFYKPLSRQSNSALMTASVARRPLAPIAENVKLKAQDMVVAALADIDDDETGEDPDYLAELALERVLERLRQERAQTHSIRSVSVSSAIDRRPSTPRIPPPSRLESVMSTHNEELEDSLYFNRVLRHCVATKSKTKRRSLSNSVFAGVDGLLCAAAAASSLTRTHQHHHDEDTPDPSWHKVKLLLTRDQLVWFNCDGYISEHIPESGFIRDVPAETADPVAIALDEPGALDPAGRIHLSTILRLDVRHPHKELSCATTAHVIVFHFDNSRMPADWKQAILDAIDQEGDDDPIHPLITARQRSSDPSSFQVPGELLTSLAGHNEDVEDEHATESRTHSASQISTTDVSRSDYNSLKVEDLLEEVRRVDAKRKDSSSSNPR